MKTVKKNISAKFPSCREFHPGLNMSPQLLMVSQLGNSISLDCSGLPTNILSRPIRTSHVCNIYPRFNIIASGRQNFNLQSYFPLQAELQNTMGPQPKSKFMFAVISASFAIATRKRKTFFIADERRWIITGSVLHFTTAVRQISTSQSCSEKCKQDNFISQRTPGIKTFDRTYVFRSNHQSSPIAMPGQGFLKVIYRHRSESFPEETIYLIHLDVHRFPEYVITLFPIALIEKLPPNTLPSWQKDVNSC